MLWGGLFVVTGCETTDRKFVSGTSAAGPTATLPEAGVDPAPNVDSLPVCPAGASCEESGCTDDGQCAEPMRPHCDVESGSCVACLDDSQCLEANAAHCELAPTPTRFACTGCTDDEQCDGKPGLGTICRARDGLCVGCLTDAECTIDARASRCAADGQCVPCENDGDCALFGDGLDVCLSAGGQNRCVECTDDSHCIGSDIGTICKTSSAGAGNGPGIINTCVECVSNLDCTEPSASLCMQNVCVPCATNADCGALSNLGICDLSGGASGGSPQCVQCTGLQFQACANGTNVCNSLTRECTNMPIGSARDDCDTCVSDAHCDIDTRCVQEKVGGTGYFCFPVNDPTCTSFPFSILTTGTIDSPSQTACTLGRTSCAAFLDFALQSCQVDADCGLPDVEDGICTSADGQGDLCSIPCFNGSDCSGGTCSGGVCDL